MGTPRIIVPGSTVAITRRAVLRKAFLGPWDARVEQLWLYALADAQRVHDVALHHAVRCVSHHHLEVTAAEPNLPEFLHRFHRDVSCALNTLLAMERYDAPREVFDGRQPHVMQLVDDAAQMRHLLYSHLSPVAAGLVARPADMPGRVLGFDDWLGDGVLVKRPDFYFAKDRPEELRLVLTPPLRLLAIFGGDLKALVYHLGRLVDDGCRALCATRTRPVVGAERLKGMHPWAEPRTLATSGGKRVPSFKVGALSEADRDLRRRCAQEVTAFRSRYRDTRERRLRGEDAVFPHGSYGPRIYYGAPVEPKPDPDALLAVAGPASLEDALGGAESDAARAHRNLVLDDIREAQREEIADMLEQELLNFEEDTDDFGARRVAQPPAGQRPAAEGDPSAGAHPTHPAEDSPSQAGRAPLGTSPGGALLRPQHHTDAHFHRSRPEWRPSDPASLRTPPYLRSFQPRFGSADLPARAFSLRTRCGSVGSWPPRDRASTTRRGDAWR